MTENTHKNTLWTEEEDASLRRWYYRLSAYGIGKLLKKTRCAVIGRARRLGLSMAPELVKARKDKKAVEEQLRSDPAVIAILRAKARDRMKALRIARLAAEAAKEGKMREGGTDDTPEAAPAHAVPLMELREHHCRAIVGHDGLALYCGARKMEGSSYCPGHYRLFVYRRAA